MNKNRLEAFSDGVFAIAITLLILDIRVPDVKYDDLYDALMNMAPRITTYVMSFVLIGAYWIFHHFYFDRVDKINGTFLWINLLMLMLVSFMPFPTALMSKYPLKPIPLVIYGITLMATNLTGYFAHVYIYRHPEFVNEKFTEEYYRKTLPSYIWVNGCYLVALVLAFFYPLASYIIYIAVLVAIGLMVKKRINHSV